MQRTLALSSIAAGISLVTLFGIARFHKPIVRTSPPINIKPVASHSVSPTVAYDKLPLAFESNQGQVDKQVQFLSHGPGYNLFLTSNQAVLTLKHVVRGSWIVDRGQSPEHLTNHEPRTTNHDAVNHDAILHLKLLGANPDPKVSGQEKLPGIVNYFVGNDPAKWRTQVPTYSRVQYKGVYPGIDMVYYGNRHQLEYDWVVSPGADVHQIQLEVTGAERASLTAEGDLKLHTECGDVIQHAPVIYQVVEGVRKPVAGRLVLREAQKGEQESRIGFDVGVYDPTRPLVIDPVLVYSTYLGGSVGENGYGIAVDGSGNAYITGNTSSNDFPTKNPIQSTNKAISGDDSAFVARIGNYNWQTVDVAVGNDDNAHLLWNNTTSTLGLWSVNNSGATSNLNNIGPFTGYAAQALATGSDGLTRLLWLKNNQTAALWILNANNSFNTGFNFGPYTDWAAIDVAVGSDNRAKLLWNKSDGTAAIWTVDNQGNLSNLTNFGPYTGWQATRIAAGSDGLTRLLWTKNDGSIGLWLLNSDNSYNNGVNISAATGWSAIDIAVGSDNKTRLLWSKSDGTVGVWTVDNKGNYSSLTNFGPYPGWTATRIAAGSDGSTRLLWFKADGTQALWLLNSNNAFINGFNFGPY